MKTYQHSKAKVMVIGVLLIVLWGIMHAGNASSGTYTDTAHGNKMTGADRSVIDGVGEPYSTEIPKGHCPHCHDPPGACDEQSNLFMNNYGADKNALCYACHELFDFGYGLGYGRYGFYMGKGKYEGSVHNTSANMIMTWPGALFPGPAVNDAGNCNNCHTPHGYDDGSGLIAHMLFQRDGATGNEMGCYSCHGDNPAEGTYNIKAEASKAYGHPIHDYDDRHRVDESRGVGLGAGNRHAECVDCHNPHTVGGGTLDWGSDALYGTWGVMPSKWGDIYHIPSEWYELRPPAYPEGAENEGQVCFKCHSNYAGAVRDIANEIKGANMSRHPIGTGMSCTRCHGNDAGSAHPAGVHRSKYPNMLKPDYGTDRGWWPQFFTLENPGYDTNFCFNCHWGVSHSRVSHSAHQGYTCTTCHSTRVHGLAEGEAFCTFTVASGFYYTRGAQCHPTCGK